MCKLIVKPLIYKQLIVYSIFLFSSCQEVNRFEKDDVIQIHTFADQRDAQGVITYLTNEDASLREQAALEFSSLHDSTAIAPLLKLAEFDEAMEVRAAAAYSLGQFRMVGLKNLMLRLLQNENDAKVINQLVIAIGKSSGAEELVKLSKTKKEIRNIYEGLFYASVAGIDLKPLKEFLLEGLNLNSMESFYAAAAMVRADIDLSNNKEILIKSLSSSENSDFRYTISILLGQNFFTDLELAKLIRSQPDYLSRLGFLRGADKNKKTISTTMALPFLEDSVFHVREQAAILLNKISSNDFTSVILPLAQKEKYARIKYLLYETAINTCANEDLCKRISEQLALDYKENGDEYVKGFILKALSSNRINYEFVFDKTFSTESILVRGAGVEALFNSMNNPQNYDEKKYKELIYKSLETRDVALCSMAAIAMRDTSKYNLSDKEKDIELLKNVLSFMRLPRDIETYSDLFLSMQGLMGRNLKKNIKPEFNNPINWELCSRIPDDIKILIETERGDIELELWVNEAPGTVANFISLIQDSFFVDKRLHRVVPGFVVQDGCPRGDGYGSIMKTIRSEFSYRANFEAGTLGMASSGEDTESCQWFITHVNTPHLNGRYTAFGKVISGMEIVHQLSLGDRIYRIRILPNQFF
ncbi:MAG: peptidylprolyl isomerase [Bacteroidia bacterium]